MTDKLFNVTVRAVKLVWAESRGTAIASLADEMDSIGAYALPDGRDAFVSEPVRHLGWLPTEQAVAEYNARQLANPPTYEMIVDAG
jgi:hypothetical protein